MPFCYSKLIFMFRHVSIDHKCKKNQIKKGSSMNIRKIKQKLSTQELVYITTINICASISLMKYLDYFVVSYISMYTVFRSTPRTRVRLNCQGRRIQAETSRCTKWKYIQICMTLSIEKILMVPGLFTYVFINQSKYILQRKLSDFAFVKETET